LTLQAMPDAVRVEGDRLVGTRHATRHEVQVRFHHHCDKNARRYLTLARCKQGLTIKRYR
jgi:hypothetical protein